MKKLTLAIIVLSCAVTAYAATYRACGIDNICENEAPGPGVFEGGVYEEYEIKTPIRAE